MQFYWANILHDTFYKKGTQITLESGWLKGLEECEDKETQMKNIEEQRERESRFRRNSIPLILIVDLDTNI